MRECAEQLYPNVINTKPVFFVCVYLSRLFSFFDYENTDDLCEQWESETLTPRYSSSLPLSYHLSKLLFCCVMLCMRENVLDSISFVFELKYNRSLGMHVIR